MKQNNIYGQLMTKRRYTKKKKSVKDKDTTDIPYTKVRVEWVDCVSDSAWASDKEFKNMKLATPVNEGWIFSKDRKSIKLFASYDKEDDGTITFGDRTMIPKSWIVKITEIQKDTPLSYKQPCRHLRAYTT